jgi:hypothetical protein
MMNRKRFTTLIVGLIATFGVAQANAEDRFFMVTVELIAGGQSPFFVAPNPPGPNCYSFLGDGTWIDPLFPDPVGTWESDPNGMITRYTAMADWDGVPGVIPPLLLVQDGQITPTTGNGTVRLQAFSTLFIAETPIVLAEFMSTGYEVDGCP